MPPTQMSAPESGKTCSAACPLREDMWTLIMGAGSKVGGGLSLVEAISGVAETVRAPGAVGVGRVGGWYGCLGVSGCGRRPRHTLPKWPTFLHRWHVML